MRIFSVLTACALLVGSMARPANAAVVDFSGLNNEQVVPNGYGNTGNVTFEYMNAAAYNYGGDGTIYANGGDLLIKLTAMNDKAVELDSFLLSRYYDEPTIRYSYSLDGGSTFSPETTVSNVPKTGDDGPVNSVLVELTGVVSAVNGSVVLKLPLVVPLDPIVDNITFNEVPEPASISLLGFAAAGLMYRRRRA